MVVKKYCTNSSEAYAYLYHSLQPIDINIIVAKGRSLSSFLAIRHAAYGYAVSILLVELDDVAVVTSINQVVVGLFGLIKNVGTHHLFTKLGLARLAQFALLGMSVSGLASPKSTTLSGKIGTPPIEATFIFSTAALAPQPSVLPQSR
jgi:hypothetical protein